MEPQCSLPCSQNPANFPIRETYDSSRYPLILWFTLWYYLPIYAQLFQMVPLLQVPPPKLCIHLYFHLYCHMPRPSLTFYLISHIIFPWGLLMILIMLFSPATSYFSGRGIFCIRLILSECQHDVFTTFWTASATEQMYRSFVCCSIVKIEQLWSDHSFVESKLTVLVTRNFR